MDLSPLSSITRDLEPVEAITTSLPTIDIPAAPATKRVTRAERIAIYAIHFAVAAVAFALGWYMRAGSL